MRENFLALPPQQSAPSRSVPIQRVNKIRFSWFVVGATLGSVVTSVLSNLILGYPAAQLASHISAANQTPVAVIEKKAEPEPLKANPLNDGAKEIAAAKSTEQAKPLEPAKAKIKLPAEMTIEIKRGQSVVSILTNLGVTQSEASDVMDSIRKVHNPRRITAGEDIELKLVGSKSDATIPTVKELRVAVNSSKTIKVTRKGEDFLAEAINKPLVKVMARGGGIITSSIYQTGNNAGIPSSIMNDIIKAFSYEVDFQRDVKDGDRLDVLYERTQTEDGKQAGYGNVLYAALTVNGKKKEIYRHESKEGFANWYNEMGESIRKALLKTPINGARISSGFGMRRHPIQGYSKMHKGVDFAAPTGTPIFASGDGVVEFAGRKNGYGNYVKVKHNATYASAYAHASRIARGIREGVKVKQGQVIAYVGSTGQSTGPHLHYEILVNNQQVNPNGVKFKTGQSLAGKELAQFKKTVQGVEVALNKIPLNKTLAMNDIARTR